MKNDGFRGREIVVEPFASTIPDRILSKYTRQDLIDLRRAINKALKTFPLPPSTNWKNET